MNRLIIMLTLLLTPAWAGADGRMAQHYDIEGTRSIEAHHAVKVSIRQGETDSLRVEARKEVLDRVVVHKQGEKLNLGVEHPKGFWHWFGGNSHDEVRFVLTLTELTALKLEGASQASLSGFSTPGLQLTLGGASRARLENLEALEVHINLWGASHITFDKLQGRTLEAEISGASGLAIKKAASMEHLKLAISGASHYEATSVPVTRAEVEASGASSVELGTTQRLDARASGGSRIDYRGQPELRQEASGGSRIRSR